MTPGDESSRLVGGRYRIDGLVGRGGMSEVFHGYDERLDRPVAIKMLRPPAALPAGDGPEVEEFLDTQRRNRDRFVREIRTAARLEHPGTPAVYDTGVEERPDGSSQIWLVMQLLRGSTLEGTLDRADYESAPPEVSWAAAIGAQIGAVLADVHREDVVHRDIKPANIMIVDGGLVKVLDFGISILRGAGALPRLTQVDRTVGSPPYMSPEQNLGRAVTAASDIYSLGCLLYELLTGDPPYLDKPDLPVRAQHLQSPIPSAHAARAAVPEPLDQLITAMLAKEAADRPTAEAVYQALVPHIGQQRRVTADDQDPARPFRTPLLAPPTRRSPGPSGPPLSEDELDQIRVQAGQLVERGANTEAVHLLEAGLERTSGDRFTALELSRILGLALFFAGEYRRAASILSAAGQEYRSRGLPVSHSRVLDCAYYAGHAFAEIADVTSALAQLRFFVRNVGPDTRMARRRCWKAGLSSPRCWPQMTGPKRPSSNLKRSRHLSAVQRGAQSSTATFSAKSTGFGCCERFDVDQMGVSPSAVLGTRRAHPWPAWRRHTRRPLRHKRYRRCRRSPVLGFLDVARWLRAWWRSVPESASPRT